MSKDKYEEIKKVKSKVEGNYSVKRDGPRRKISDVSRGSWLIILLILLIGLFLQEQVYDAAVSFL